MAHDAVILKRKTRNIDYEKPWDGSTTFITKKRINGKMFTQFNRLGQKLNI